MSELICNEAYCAKIEEVMTDESFLEKLHGVMDVDKIRQMFAERGLILPEDVLAEIKRRLNFYEETGELDDDTLELVSGGRINWAEAKKCLRYSFDGMVLGGIAGASVGGAYGAVVGMVVGMAAGYWLYTRTRR